MHQFNFKVFKEYMNMYLLSEDQRFFFYSIMNGTMFLINPVPALLHWLNYLRTAPIARHVNSTMKGGLSEESKYLIPYKFHDFGHKQNKMWFIILIVR